LLLVSYVFILLFPLLFKGLSYLHSHFRLPFHPFLLIYFPLALPDSTFHILSLPAYFCPMVCPAPINPLPAHNRRSMNTELNSMEYGGDADSGYSAMYASWP
jgi:hypothetical protein